MTRCDELTPEVKPNGTVVIWRGQDRVGIVAADWRLYLVEGLVNTLRGRDAG